jgi:hypothetical protein
LIEIEKYLFVTNFSTRRSFAEGHNSSCTVSI